MDPKKSLDFVDKLGLPPRLLTILEVGVPIALAVGAVVLAWVIARRKKKKPEPPPVEVAGAASGASAGLSPAQLRRAWLRFLHGLPVTYRRSILNFEHYVVIGGPSSGKSRVIDAYSDWRRQAKEFLSSQSFDPDLQVYLGSWAVVMELPARILVDYTEKCHRALDRLWRPLYRGRSPTVLAVVDVSRLRDATPDEITDLAERMRGKINVLSRIRRRPIEVRVVLTHLDSIDGFGEFADLCRDQSISMRMPIEVGKDKAPPAEQIEAFLTSGRGHLARALVTMPTDKFRRAVGFVRSAPAMAPSVGAFVAALFAHEALSPTPTCGGVFLARDGAALPSPLRNPVDRAPGPDPLTRHMVLAAGLTGAVLMYLTLAFLEQRSLCRRAVAALHDYEPNTVGTETESAHRAAIRDFATYEHGVLVHPDFFRSTRENLRAQFSRQLRDELLVPRLRLVAKNGAVLPESAPLGWRRTLYYLALIHGDRSDQMHILDSQWLRVWSQMTELPPDLISDYLTSTDVAYRRPVAFELANISFDSRDDVGFWSAFLRDLGAYIEHGAMKPADLKPLQTRAGDLLQSLDSFEYDEKTLGILGELDAAASYTVSKDPQEGRPQLKAAYTPRYEGVLTSAATADLYAQREDLKVIFRAVRAGAIVATDVPLLSSLADRLAAFSQDTDDPATSRVITVKLGAQEFAFDTRKWSAMLRNSKAAEQITLFLRPRLANASIFFGPEADGQLRPVAWNPDNDGTSMFLGKAEIEPRYTRTAFDTYVLAAVVKASDALDKSAVPDDTKRALADLVRSQVSTYATEYRSQVARFYRSFGTHAASSQELRVVISQMVAETSPFATFLGAIDRQLGVTTGHPWLAAMDDALGEFGSLRKVVDSSSGAPEVGKYREILRQLLADLGPAPEPGPGASAAATAPAADAKPTLETSLSPAGALTLRSIRGQKGSYPTLVRDWLSSVQLPESQQRPFVLPVEQLTALGLKEIEREVARDWDRDAMAGLSALVDKFPFNPTGTEEVQPAELEAFFDPAKGSFFDAFRRYFEPVSEFGDGKPFRELSALRGRIGFPGRMFALVNAVAALSSRLYDTTGKPRPLDVRIGTVPFDHGSNPSAALTLAYLTVGETTIFNFNQKPSITTVHFDWTREQPSQVGVQLTDVDTRDNKFPTPMAVEPSHFSLFRLLSLAAEAKPVKGEPGTVIYSWNPGTEKDGARARFATYGDALDVFSALAAQVKGLHPEAGGRTP